MPPSIRHILAALLGVFALGAAASARAQSCTASIPAGNYGNVDILSGGTVDTTATFTISCTGSRNQTLRLCIDVSYGDTVNGAGQVRALTYSGKYLLHDIYSDAARSLELGSWGGGDFLFPFGSGGVQRDFSLGSTGSFSQTLTLYGRIAANQQTAVPGVYTWATASAGFTFFYGTTTSCPAGTLYYRGNPGSSVWTATILANCLVSATNVDFGATGVIVNQIDGQGAITARCTNTTPYAIALSNGAGGGTGPTARKMAKGGETVTYGLYQDSARTLPFGSTTGVDTYSATGTGLAQTINVYGRVPVQATPSAGAYADTITVTLTY